MTMGGAVACVGWLLEFYHGPLLWGLVDVTSPTTTGERTCLSLNTGEFRIGDLHNT